MTDEEKDIYDICLEKKSLYCVRRMGEETCDKCKTYKMYKLGLTEGKKEKWHDLRKNPDDLPKDKGNYWAKYNDLHEERGGYYDVHYFNPNNSFYKQKWHKLEIIAWCELPRFEE